MKEHKNAICQAKGFKSAALACGLKKNEGLDLALIYSEVPALSCGMFTRNRFTAHPVKISQEHLRSGQAQAIVVNSGNANCYTGKRGLLVARETVRWAAKLLGLKDTSVLVASTGIIGKQLDFAKIKKALPVLVSSLDKNNASKVAWAIMTTDTQPKELTAKINISGIPVTIGAIAKGAGMIAPDMVYAKPGPRAALKLSRRATMLCFITTDCLIAYSALKAALREAVEASFNMISVDSCMSTNDSVIILANGLSGNRMLGAGKAGFIKFKIALKEICLNLAKMIVKDGEGATKFITIEVSQARNDSEAKKAALSIANSNLFKTAMYGENPNFGRVVAAVGAAGVKVKDSLKINCSPLNKKEISLRVVLGVGLGSARVYTSDLTPEYIRINAEYN